MIPSAPGLDEEGVTSLACGQGGRWQAAVTAACAGRSVLTPAGEFAGWKGTSCLTPVRRGSPTARGHRRYRDAGVVAGRRRAAHLIPGAPCPYRPAGGLHHRRQPGRGGGRTLAAGHAHQSAAGLRPPRPPTSSRPWPTAPTARAACWWCWWRIADGWNEFDAAVLSRIPQERLVSDPDFVARPRHGRQLLPAGARAHRAPRLPR